MKDLTEKAAIAGLSVRPMASHVRSPLENLIPFSFYSEIE